MSHDQVASLEKAHREALDQTMGASARKLEEALAEAQASRDAA